MRILQPNIIFENIKKSILKGFILGLLLCSPQVHAQQGTSSLNFQLNPYFGFLPHDIAGEVGFLFKPGDAKFIGSPMAVGVQFEWLSSKRFCPIIDLNFSYIGYHYFREDYEINKGNYSVFEDRTYSRTVLSLRAFIGFNLCLIQKEEQQAYFTLGFGYKYVKRAAKLNGESVDLPTFLGFDVSHALVPISLRLGIGYKHNITKDFSVFGEVGIGAAPIKLGLGIKF